MNYSNVEMEIETLFASQVSIYLYPTYYKLDRKIDILYFYISIYINITHYIQVYYIYNSKMINVMYMCVLYLY
jgi:hypothetical protein